MDPPGLALLLVHALLAAFMAGLIWTIQIVHYPLFPHAAGPGWPAFHARHSARITWIVGPVMAAETALAVWLAVAPPVGVDRALTLTAVVLLGVVHLTTAGLSVPAHNALTDGFAAGPHRRLVATNWLRTAGWSARAVLAVVIVHQAVGPLTPRSTP